MEGGVGVIVVMQAMILRFRWPNWDLALYEKYALTFQIGWFNFSLFFVCFDKQNIFGLIQFSLIESNNFGLNGLHNFWTHGDKIVSLIFLYIIESTWTRLFQLNSERWRCLLFSKNKKIHFIHNFRSIFTISNVLMHLLCRNYDDQIDWSVCVVHGKTLHIQMEWRVFEHIQWSWTQIQIQFWHFCVFHTRYVRSMSRSIDE